ncbi:HAMP domain-containing histidine kinase [Nocardia huaxiensis]|uniref:histidine kinase n=1 Tax=Nocardia huaxiensis TaxID=2755382 RepID=A0A7D6ZEN3_9NOCA|nr:HAMP domain-containing sensor histidine kinase [Nocardia huaxiensis]QLY28407.1 HAMP domain-containing histidine kinase [Nocardia huaxiensis]
MRRRLLAALTAFATLAVLAFALPLCLTAATSRTQQLISGRTGDADRFAALAATATALDDRRALIREIDRYHELYGEAVLVVDARGEPVVNAGVDLTDPAITAAVSAARRNQRPATPERLTPWGQSTVLIARPIGSDVHVDGAVLIAASTTAARTDITRLWTVVAVGALAAMAACTALALLLARWVLRPLAGLSTAVSELTASLPSPHTPATMTRRHGGPPELRAVAESVDTMAAAVRDSAAAQRRLIDDTAHAMRNPLAALTIRLDSLEPAIPANAAGTFHGATREVERLTGLLDGLLTLAVAEGRDLTTPDTCDATQIADDRIDAWRSAYDDAGMTLQHQPAPEDPADTAVSAAVLAQILDVALSNSCRYAGPGATTRLAVTTTPGWVSLTVTDNGTGVPADELDRLTTRFYRGSSADGIGGSGLGLPIAAALTSARHGHLTLTAVEPHGLTVTIRLPAAVPR